MHDENYFKDKNKKKKSPKILVESIYNPSYHQLEAKKDKDEIGYLSSLDVRDQMDAIDSMGNDIGGFLQDSE